MKQAKVNDGNTQVAGYKDDNTEVAACYAPTLLPDVEVHDDEVKLLHQEQERYKTVKTLGEGGAGYVDLVADRDIHRAVARKTAKAGGEDSILVRFVEEVRVLGQLEHPNIVPIHDVGVTEEGEYYFTMKYVEGESLRDVIHKLQKGDKKYHEIYTFERRMSIFLEILHAVHFAHDHGFIHRDIKPENVMVGRYGEVSLMDWGIAKKIRDDRSTLLDDILKREASATDESSEESRIFETQHGTLIGTPAYMAPEQIKASWELDERTDIYSLTIMLHEFLTLEHYLASCDGDITLTLLGVVEKDPKRPEDMSHPSQGAVPREHCFFMRKGYKKFPDERYQSIDEMIRVVEQNLHGRTKVSCPSTFLKRSTYMYSRFLDNHRYLSVVVMVVVLLLAAMGVVQGVTWIKLLL